VKQFKYTIMEDRLLEQVNRKLTSTAKNHKAALGLVAIAALAAVLVARSAAVGSGHMSLANDGNKTKGNEGISIHTDVKQKQNVKLLVEPLQSQPHASSRPQTRLIILVAF
jgi:hypothetical protein